MLQRLKIAAKVLARTPGVTAIAILSLALGMGGTVAIFSIFYEFILHSLPIEKPGELVNFSAPGPRYGGTSCNQQGTCDEVFSYPMFRDLEKDQAVFTGIAAHRSFYQSVLQRANTEWLRHEGFRELFSRPQDATRAWTTDRTRR
jgi:hypothetical protein